MYVEVLFVDVPGSWLSSVGSLQVSVLYLLGLLAALGPFQHMSCVSSCLPQCGQGNYVSAFGVSVVYIPPGRPWSLRMRFRHFLLTYPRSLQYWHVICWCSAWMVEFDCLVSWLWLPLWEWKLFSLFPSNSTRVLVLDKQIFDRTCRFLIRLSLSTVCDVEVFFRTPNFLSTVVQDVRNFVWHFWSVLHKNLVVTSSGVENEFMPFVLLRLVIVVWGTFVGNWWARFRVFVYYWHWFLQKFVNLLCEDLKKRLIFNVSDFVGCILGIVWKPLWTFRIFHFSVED